MSERIGWKRDGADEEERRGRSETLGMGFWRWWWGVQAAPPASPVMANDAELTEAEGEGGL